MEIIEELEKHLAAAEAQCPRNKFIYTALYGSQNYGLDTPNSDVDSKAMVIPPMRDIILGKPQLSSEIVIPDTGSICTVADVRAMARCLYKGNINFVEILFTPHYLVHPEYAAAIKMLRDMRETIATRNIPNLFQMVQGMARQKFTAFAHPFESKKDILAKYGYDPKQLSHIVRLYYFLVRFDETHCFESALVLPPDAHDEILSYKIEPPFYDRAVTLRDTYMRRIEDFVSAKTHFFKVGESIQTEKDAIVRKLLDDFCYLVITKSMKE